MDTHISTFLSYHEYIVNTLTFIIHSICQISQYNNNTAKNVHTWQAAYAIISGVTLWTLCFMIRHAWAFLLRSPAIADEGPLNTWRPNYAAVRNRKIAPSRYYVHAEGDNSCTSLGLETRRQSDPNRTWTMGFHRRLCRTVYLHILQMHWVSLQ